MKKECLEHESTLSNWEYGKQMLEQGDIKSLNEWSDDKEKACSVMDNHFDYHWDFRNGIRFVDKMYESGEIDAEVQARIERGEAELFFETFEDVFTWIEEHTNNNYVKE